MDCARILFLQSKNPYTNLSVEQLLFEHLSPKELEKPTLLFWINNPAVVIGRSQNPWSEVRTEALESSNIPLIRRSSGGGTVYHDRGNLCYSILRDRKSFNREEHSKFFCTVLRGLGVDAEYTERNDLLIQGKKFSGSAFRILKNRALHHGTLLIHADLQQLSSLLTPTNSDYQSRGTASRGMKVINIQEVQSRIEINTVVQAFAQELGLSVEEISLENLSTLIPRNDCNLRESQRSLEERLRSWEWTYGATPAFTYKGRGYVKKGYLMKIDNQPLDTPFPFSPKDCLLSVI